MYSDLFFVNHLLHSTYIRNSNHIGMKLLFLWSKDILSACLSVYLSITVYLNYF